MIKSRLKKIIPNQLLKKLIYLKNFFSKSAIIYRLSLYKKKKIEKTKIISIVFVVTIPETWNSLRSVYECAEKRADCTVRVICIPDKDKRDNPAYSFLKQMYGDKVICGYNETTNCFFSLQELKPDYVFFTRPYNFLMLSEAYKSTQICRYTKICYIPYGYGLSDSHSKIFDSVFNNEFALSCYRLFVTSEAERRDVKNKFGFSISDERISYLGFPRFDFVEKDVETSYTTRKTILWLPRWTIGVEEKAKSSFLDYFEKIVTYAKQHSECNIVIRPHPLMFLTMIKNKIKTETEVEEIKEIIRRQDNLTLDENKDYLFSLKQADILLADFTSLVAEFFVTGKPIVYCDTVEACNNDAVEMLNSTYLAESFEKVEKYLNDLLSGIDPRFDDRERCISKMMNGIGLGNIGGHIVKYIVDDYRLND